MTGEKALGVDLGTTNSAMAILEGSDPRIIQNNESEDVTPSVVCYTEAGDVDVGRPAATNASGRPDRTIRSIKRHMGEDGYTVEVDTEEYTPIDVSSEILSKLKRDAEAYTDVAVERATITVPAYFNDDQKAATREAGRAAGLEVDLLNEPTAAAIAHGFNEEYDRTLIVYDFGGGTLDVSVLEISDNEFTILTTTGDNHLGGDDFDEVIVDRLVQEFNENRDVEIPIDGEYLARTGLRIPENDEIEENLRQPAREAKEELSSQDQRKILVPFAGQVDGQVVDVELTLSRDEFEEMTAEIRDRAMNPLEEAIDTVDLDTSDIDEVLMVGGTTRMPSLQDAVAEVTGVEPTMDFDPDKVVALGAAVYAQHKLDIDTGRTSGSEGSEDDEGKDTVSTDITVKDIIPRSLGTKVIDGSFKRLIEADTPITEAEGTKHFTTVEDNQSSMIIDIYQGEHEQAEDNVKLDEFLLEGIPPQPAKTPTIEVRFTVDDDGILHVEAEDRNSDVSGGITVERNVTGTGADPTADAEAPEEVTSD